MIETPIVRIEEISTLKSRENLIIYENQIYRGSISSKANVSSLADKYEMALRSPEYVVNGLTASPQITRGYNQSIKQYIKKGYMRKSQEQDKSESRSNLPHVPVIMPDQDSTETRIVHVIDTSTKIDSLSLNGAMHNRPNLQQCLFDEPLRFSRSSVAVVCGIAEMYLRIVSVPADNPCHSFLWRGSIQNCPSESKHDRKLLDPSREIEEGRLKLAWTMTTYRVSKRLE